jgi:hypothetical protein
MNNTIKRNEIYAKINEVPNGFFGMTYIKADGSVREATGRLHVKNPKHTLVPGTGAYLGESAQEALENHNNIKYFDCGVDGNPRHGQEFGKGDYRTAKIDRITRIRIKGVEYEVID